MIIWIASYPKSGNTWVRALLSSYLYSNDGIFNFEQLKKIKQFPSKEYFDFFLKDFTNIKKVSDHWIHAQERINLLNNDVTFLKTHSALCKLENNSFTNRLNTKAAIYVVRDPRNIITSFSHHYSLNVEESLNFLKNEKKILLENEYGKKNFAVATILGNWKHHYLSWKSLNFAPLLIVKYEDLINDTEKTFTSILNFLKNSMNITIDKVKVLKTVKSCSFDVMSQKEKTEQFDEAVYSKKNNEKLNFFYLGEKNNWRNLLDPNVEKKTRDLFSKEMKELGYI